MARNLKLVLEEMLLAWLKRKPVHIDVRPTKQPPPIRDLVGAAPRRRYRGPTVSAANDNRSFRASQM